MAARFNVWFSKFKDFYHSLEDTVAERTADLERLGSVGETMANGEATVAGLIVPDMIMDREPKAWRPSGASSASGRSRKRPS